MLRHESEQGYGTLVYAEGSAFSLGHLEEDKQGSLPLPPFIQDGKFRVIRSLGRGGIGKVFLCEHVEAKKLRAVKILQTQFGGDDLMERYFRREANVLFDINHENIVKVFDLHREESGDLHLVMEYLEGPTLQEIMESQSVSLRYAIEIGCQLLEGVSALHDANIAHCDVSPDNIMVVGAGPLFNVKIIDLGAAKVDVNGCLSSVDIGKPKYVAPERWSGASIGSRASDIYSAGILLYELLTGDYPYDVKPDQQDISSLKQAHLFNQPRSFKDTSLSNLTPGPVQELVLRMLDKEPGVRQGARGIAAELREFQSAKLSSEFLAAAHIAEVSRKVGVGGAAEISNVLERTNGKGLDLSGGDLNMEGLAEKLLRPPGEDGRTRQAVSSLGHWLFPLLGVIATCYCILRVVTVLI